MAFIAFMALVAFITLAAFMTPFFAFMAFIAFMAFTAFSTGFFAILVFLRSGAASSLSTTAGTSTEGLVCFGEAVANGDFRAEAVRRRALPTTGCSTASTKGEVVICGEPASIFHSG